MKNKLLRICIILSALFCLTGCMKINLDVKFDTKGQYKTNGYIYVETKYLQELNMDTNDILTILEESGFDLRQGDYQEIDTTFDNVQYTGVNFSFENGLPLNVEVDGGIKKICVDTHSFPSRIPDRIKLNVLEDDISDNELLKNLGIEANLNLTFPGKVLSYNDGNKTSFNKLSVDLINNYNNLEVVAYASLLNFLFYVLAFVIILLIIAIYFKTRIKDLFHSHRKNTSSK